MEKSKNLCFIFAVLSAIVLAFFIVAFHSVNVSAAEGDIEKTYYYTEKYYVSGNPVEVKYEFTTSKRVAIYRISTSTSSQGDLVTSLVKVNESTSNLNVSVTATLSVNIYAFTFRSMSLTQPFPVTIQSGMWSFDVGRDAMTTSSFINPSTIKYFGLGFAPFLNVNGVYFNS